MSEQVSIRCRRAQGGVADGSPVSTDGLCAPDPSAAIAQIIGHVPTAWEEIMFGNTQRFVAAYNAWFSY